MEHAQTFRTKDYWVAGALLATGKKLLRLDWQGKRAFFIFSDHRACQEAEQAFWTGDLRVPAKGFSDSLRTLKDRIHGDDNGQRSNSE